MLMLLTAQTTQRFGVEERRELDELLSGVAAGDREALAQLYRRTRTAVYGLALSFVKNAHDAQDVTQDTFVRVWENAYQYKPQGSPMGWLLAVARSLALMKLRQGARQEQLEDEEWDAIPAESPAVRRASISRISRSAPSKSAAALSVSTRRFKRASCETATRFISPLRSITPSILEAVALEMEKASTIRSIRIWKQSVWKMRIT